MFVLELIECESFLNAIQASPDVVCISKQKQTNECGRYGARTNKSIAREKSYRIYSCDGLVVQVSSIMSMQRM